MEKDQLKFEKRFDTRMKEVIVLTQDGVGAGKVEQQHYGMHI